MKKIVIILGGITICSFLAAGLFFLFGDNSTGFIHKAINEEKVHAIDNLSDIFIKSSNTDIKIIPVDSNEIKINLTGDVKASSEKSLPRLETKVSGDMLIIEVKTFSGIGFTFFMGDINLEIYLPRKYKNNLNIDVSSADVIIEGLELDDFNFEASSGELDLKAFKARKSWLKTSSGRITVVDFSGDLHLITSSGRVYVEYEKFNDDVFLKSSSGDIKLKLPQSSEFYINAGTSSGDIVTNFPISIIGSVNDDGLEGTFGNSDNKIEITTSSGDINLYH